MANTEPIEMATNEGTTMNIDDKKQAENILDENSDNLETKAEDDDIQILDPPMNSIKIEPELNVEVGKIEEIKDSLWVTNLSSTAKAADLKALFTEFGKVVAAKIFTTRNSETPVCYGFVSMSDAKSAFNAKAKLDRTNFKGKVISIDLVSRNAGIKLPEAPQVKESEKPAVQPPKIESSTKKPVVSAPTNQSKSASTSKQQQVSSTTKVEKKKQAKVPIKAPTSSSNLKPQRRENSKQSSRREVPKSRDRREQVRSSPVRRTIPRRPEIRSSDKRSRDVIESKSSRHPTIRYHNSPPRLETYERRQIDAYSAYVHQPIQQPIYTQDQIMRMMESDRNRMAREQALENDRQRLALELEKVKIEREKDQLMIDRMKLDLEKAKAAQKTASNPTKSSERSSRDSRHSSSNRDKYREQASSRRRSRSPHRLPSDRKTESSRSSKTRRVEDRVSSHARPAAQKPASIRNEIDYSHSYAVSAVKQSHRHEQPKNASCIYNKRLAAMKEGYGGSSVDLIYARSPESKADAYVGLPSNRAESYSSRNVPSLLSSYTRPEVDARYGASNLNASSYINRVDSSRYDQAYLSTQAYSNATQRLSGQNWVGTSTAVHNSGSTWEKQLPGTEWSTSANSSYVRPDNPYKRF